MQWLTGIPFEIGRLVTRYKQATVSFERMAALLQGAPSRALVQHVPIYLNGHYPDVPFHPKREQDCLRTLEARKLSYHFPARKEASKIWTSSCRVASW